MINGNNLFIKLTVVGVIALFIGICFVPATAKVQCDHSSVVMEKQVGKFGDVFLID